jgi:hypothetical protein
MPLMLLLSLLLLSLRYCSTLLFLLLLRPAAAPGGVAARRVIVTSVRERAPPGRRSLEHGPMMIHCFASALFVRASASPSPRASASLPRSAPLRVRRAAPRLVAPCSSSRRRPASRECFVLVGARGGAARVSQQMRAPCPPIYTAATQPQMAKSSGVARRGRGGGRRGRGSLSCVPRFLLAACLLERVT